MLCEAREIETGNFNAVSTAPRQPTPLRSVRWRSVRWRIARRSIDLTQMIDDNK